MTSLNSLDGNALNVSLEFDNFALRGLQASKVIGMSRASGQPLPVVHAGWSSIDSALIPARASIAGKVAVAFQPSGRRAVDTHHQDWFRFKLAAP